MYRAVALMAKEKGCGCQDNEKIHEILDQIDLSFDDNGQILLGGREVASQLKSMEIAMLASELSTLPDVRERMVNRQKEIGSDGAVVLEGRDIGSVVFPDAELKVFLVADPDVRAERRLEEMRELGTVLSLDEIKEQIVERDRRDRERTLSPLTKAPDAIELDTSSLTIDGQVNRVVELAKQRMLELGMPLPKETLNEGTRIAGERVGVTKGPKAV